MSVGAARELTVARVREQPDLNYVEIMFLESPRIFHLSRSHERFEQLLARLQHANVTRRISRVTFAAPESGDIAEVEET